MKTERALIPDEYFQALEKITAGLKDEAVIWVVTGSVGMALQGMPLEVHDIDLQTDRDGAYIIERALVNFSVQPVRFVESERIQSLLGMLIIDGIKVEIMGGIQKRLENLEWEQPVQVETYRVWLDVNGMRVPVMSLEYEYQAYLKMGRTQKAEMIRDWLRK
ncbi:MAG: nucleotidyltransferase domain-containing protein [Bellilinea sp.]